MSKRFWLPTHKAGDLFPKTTQAPTKLVIRGIPADTPLYHAVANEFGGRLKTFHAKAQQAYANSINQVFKTRFTWGDEAQATYTNIQGNELLELEVSRGALEHIQSKIEELYPNVVLISFEYDNMWDATAQHIAHMVVPSLAPLPVTWDFLTNIRGTAIENSFVTDDGPPSVLAFPQGVYSNNLKYKEPFVTLTADGHWRSTLVLDTTPIYGLDVYTVEIYVYSSQRSSTCDFIGWSKTSGNTVHTRTLFHEWQELLGNIEPFKTGPYDLVYPDDYYIPVDAAPENENWRTLPAGTPLTITPSWLTSAPNFIAVDNIGGTFNGIVTSYGVSYASVSVPGTYDHYTGESTRHAAPSGGEPGYTWEYEWSVTERDESHGLFEYDRTYQRNFTSSYQPKTATVKGTLIDGASLGVSHTSGTTSISDDTPCGPYNGALDYYSWELLDAYPVRPITWNLGEVSTNPSAITDPQLYQSLGAGFLCRITFDRKHRALSMSTER